MNRIAAGCAIAAALLCLAAVGGFGSVLDGYSQAYHPIGLLGGKGIAGAFAFNLLGFVLPGTLAAIAISTLRTRLLPAAGWGVRIGVQLLVLSAIAFAAQGVVSLGPADLDAPSSRFHAVAWTLWWIAFVSGALLLAWSVRRHRPLAWVSVIAAAIVLTLAVFLPDMAPSGVTERMALATWFAWLLLAGAHPGAMKRYR